MSGNINSQDQASEDQKQRLHAMVKGRVQGVGFRHFVMQNAGELNLTGWVRNRRGGTVEVVAEGPRFRLEELLNRLHSGPVSASVRGVEHTWGEYQDSFTGFRVKATY